MKELKATNYLNFILYMLLIYTPIMSIGLAFVCYNLAEYNKELVFILLLFMVLLQIPSGIFLCKRMSINRDYLITNKEIIQNNICLVNSNDIISVKRINFIKVEIKYNYNNEEKSIYLAMLNKKYNELMDILKIYE